MKAIKLLYEDAVAYHDDITMDVPAVKAFWQKFLSLKKNEINTIDWVRAQHLAESWNTCACGSINDGLPRDWDNDPEGSAEPMDGHLTQLGNRFMHEVTFRHLKRAQELFSLINDRAYHILNNGRP